GPQPQRRSVVWVTVNSLEAVPSALQRAKKALTAQHTSGLETTEDVIEVSIPLPQPIDNDRLESIVQDVMGAGNGIKRVTVPVGRGNKKELETPQYRTFRPNGPNKEFIHHDLFEDIHPWTAWRLELDRWHDNFILERQPSLFPEVHVMRAKARD